MVWHMGRGQWAGGPLGVPRWVVGNGRHRGVPFGVSVAPFALAPFVGVWGQAGRVVVPNWIVRRGQTR